MARPLRIELPGAVYYVTSRGNGRFPIFEHDEDRFNFLDVLSATLKRFNWICHGYCLLDDHYHLVVETPDANLSPGMRQLNGVYTQRFNRENVTAGHVFRGRFKSVIIEKEEYLLEVCRHLVLNPVRVGLVSKPSEYLWSSYLATAGFCNVPTYISIDWILGNFGSDRIEAKLKYQQYVNDPEIRESPWEDVKGQCILGTSKYIDELKVILKEMEKTKEIPAYQRFAFRPELEEIFPGDSKPDKKERNLLIKNAHLEFGYTLSEIGRFLDLHYSTVSKIVKSA